MTTIRPCSKIQLAVAVLAAGCLLVQSASANLIFSEAFNYSVGPLVGDVNPGNSSAWAGGVNGSFLNVTNVGNLTYAGLPDQGGNAMNILNGNAGTIANYFTPVTSGQIYYSFLLDVLQQNNGNSYISALNPGTSTPNGATDVLDTYVYSNGHIAIRAGGTYGISSTAATIGTTYFVVEEYDYANNLSSLFINPVPGASQPAASVTATPGISVTSIADIGFKAQSGTGHFIVDNLLIGTTWADVTPTIPEPSTFALMGLGLGFIAAVIRRRRS